MFAGDPAWVAPLDMMIREQLHPKKNPFFEHAEGALFTAWRDGKLVGRISAQIDQEHLKRYNDATGFFGFFDTIDDPEVARALLDARPSVAQARGHAAHARTAVAVDQRRGRLLVEGFDTRRC